MAFSYYYIVAACLAFLAGIYSPSMYFSVVWFWIGGSLSAVAIAYVFERPEIFRKKHDGSIPFYIRWLFIPFLFGVQLYNTWARKNDSVPAIQKIQDNLFLACRLFPSDMEELKHHGIRAILDVTAEFDGLDWSATEANLHYLNVPVLDHQSPTSDQLVHAINWLNTQTTEHPVVIHCALGRGRSVFVMAAYLLSKYPEWDIAKALETIHGVRRTAGLNRKQLKALKKIQASGILSIKQPLAIIANPVSGGGKWQDNKDEIIQRLSVKYAVSVFETKVDITAESLTQKAIKKGHKVVVACGGDGTVSEVASVVTKTANILGVIPMGTTNAFSHVLHGTGSKVYPIALCCEAIIAGKPKTIDTALCNDELVLLMASIGFGQKMIESADRQEKDLGGQFAYLKGLWNAVQLDETFHLKVKFDEAPELTIETTSLVVANAAPFSTVLAQGGGGPNIADGLLDITWLPSNHSVSAQVFNLADLAFSGLAGAEVNPDIQFRQSSRVRISSHSPLKYMVDGENRQADALILKVQPSSLKVMV
ncbi:diacylglycerol kinase family protein [uncultured Paraglaciecola sp.]|uniref:diacylglycerol kinase family protein n=1 Tax=uncultured Paraglaciecola sp. TaxID=1765024 RepID=UPI0030D88EFF|tara:strand:- start:54084 stop:55691 length:1608 start_codon:yes stop_codon:yes gene_type:complete